MKRRQFVFWFGFGLFALGEKIHVAGLDRLAAAAMRLAEPTTKSPAAPEHWAAAENRTWRWYERETFVDGQWKLTGITTPINKQTGQPYTGRTGYLDESLVPAEMRHGDRAVSTNENTEERIETGPNKPDPTRRARHGRPPSIWLRSLQTDEIRIWLKTIEVPEVGVSGMTYLVHLTRDHSFDLDKIAGLTDEEQAKLHAAAHYGY
jgi:hypothetical protein